MNGTTVTALSGDTALGSPDPVDPVSLCVFICELLNSDNLKIQKGQVLVWQDISIIIYLYLQYLKEVVSQKKLLAFPGLAAVLKNVN